MAYDEFLADHIRQKFKELDVPFEDKKDQFLDDLKVFENGKFVQILDPEWNKIELWEANDAEF